MTFDVEVLLKGTDEVVTESVNYPGPEPPGWTDTDVREVLLSILRVFDRVNRRRRRSPVRSPCAG